MKGHAAVTIVSVGAFLALPILAFYQYQLIDHVAAAQHARLESQLNNALNGFVRDFTREIAGAEASVGVLGSPGRRRSPVRRMWGYRSSQPQLVKAAFFAELVDQKQLRLLRLPAKAAPLQDASWPPELSGLYAKLLASGICSSSGNWRIFADVPALVHPVGNEFSAPAIKMAGITYPIDKGCIIVILNSSYIYQLLLPRLTQQYFQHDLHATWHIHIWIPSYDNRIIYDSAPQQSFSKVSLKTTLFEGPSGQDAQSGYVQGEQLVSADGPWLLAGDEENSPAFDLLDNFRATSMTICAAIFLVLAGALITLVAAARRARGLARVQWEFVSAVTHELRTPLTALHSIAENMCDGVVSPGRFHRYGQLIEIQLERLSQMVEDVLEFGRSPGRCSTESSGIVDIAAVLDDALAAYASTIERQGFRIVRNVPAGLPAAQCSAPALRRSLENLIGNAIKYGAAEQWIGVCARPSGNGEVIISIENKGCGIEPDERKRVFEPFFRGRSARAAQVPGTGLGLTVAKQSIESLGGRITVESEPGRWTRFDLFVPIAKKNEYETTDSHR